MTAKQPPSHDGKVSWFGYEELVDDWVTFTTIEAPKRGPLLKSRLIGVLQNDLLQDPDEGVNYFKNTLKKFFLKGSTNVYLYRLLSFFNHRRQNTEFLRFTSKFEILLMRLKAAWMDLMPTRTAQSPEFLASVQDANTRKIAARQQAAVHEHRLQICYKSTIQKYSGSIRSAEENKTNCNVIEKHLA